MRSCRGSRIYIYIVDALLINEMVSVMCEQNNTLRARPSGDARIFFCNAWISFVGVFSSYIPITHWVDGALNARAALYIYIYMVYAVRLMASKWAERTASQLLYIDRAADGRKVGGAHSHSGRRTLSRGSVFWAKFLIGIYRQETTYLKNRPIYCFFCLTIFFRGLLIISYTHTRLRNIETGRRSRKVQLRYGWSRSHKDD